MKLSTIKSISKVKKKTYDITVENNHNFFCNDFLIHNCDYRGEIKVILINLGKEPYKINIGDKMAQIIFSAYTVHEFKLVDELSQTERAEKGFGSTDIKPEPIPSVKSIDKLDAAIDLSKQYDKNIISITKESIGAVDLNVKGFVTHNNTLPIPPRTNSDIIEEYKKHGGNISHIKPYEEQIREKMKSL